MARVEIKGIKELQRTLKELGDVPQKVVTPASRKGMNVVLKAAKAFAPEDTGELKRGMKLVGERSRHKGKKVYQIVFDRAKNDIFQKINKAGKVGGYYPASQEYGFYAVDGKYIPGYHFLERALVGNAEKLRRTIMDEMFKRIDKAMKG